MSTTVTGVASHVTAVYPDGSPGSGLQLTFVPRRAQGVSEPIPTPFTVAEACPLPSVRTMAAKCPTSGPDKALKVTGVLVSGAPAASVTVAVSVTDLPTTA